MASILASKRWKKEVKSRTERRTEKKAKKAGFLKKVFQDVGGVMAECARPEKALRQYSGVIPAWTLLRI